MNWLILIVAGLFEVVWAVALKKSDGFRNVWADAVFLVGMVSSMWLLSLSLRTIPLGSATMRDTPVAAVATTRPPPTSCAPYLHAALEVCVFKDVHKTFL